MIPSSGMLQCRLACLYACYVPKLPCGDTDTPIFMPALSQQCCNSTRHACLHACCEAQAHLFWCMLCWAYLFTYLPCFIAATWWRGHGFFVCLLYPGVPGRCMDTLVSTAAVSQHCHLVARECRFACPLSPRAIPWGYGGFCLCSSHVPAWECLSASRSCPALPCGSCSVLQCPRNATYCATIWALLFPSDATWLCRQCGRIYSCAYCVSTVPLGGISTPDCMHAFFVQAASHGGMSTPIAHLHMAAWACMLACWLCPSPSRWQPGMPVHVLTMSQCHHMESSIPVCIPDTSQHYGNAGAPVLTPSPTSWCHEHACLRACHVPALLHGDANMLVCAPAASRHRAHV